jgi:hypothetical protein
MKVFNKFSMYIILVSCVCVIFLCSNFASGSVKYVFVVNGAPNSTFHQPFNAELVLSDAAVAAKVAKLSDIESLRIVAGAAIPDINPITIHDLLSSEFLNAQVNLSADAESVIGFTAVGINGSPYNNLWVFYQNYPHNPSMSLVENTAIITSNGISLESCVLPIPPKFYNSTFLGSWKRELKSPEINIKVYPN